MLAWLAVVGALCGSVQDDDRRVSTVVYDVRDLVVVWGPFRAPAEAGMLIDQAMPPDEAPGSRMAEIVADIRSIQPQRWRGNGGRQYSVTWLNGNVVVTTTGANHETIDAMLAERRANASVGVHMEFHVMRMTGEALETLPVELDVHGDDDAGIWMTGVMDPASLERLAVMKVEGDVEVLSVPSLTTLDGCEALVEIASRGEPRTLPLADDSGDLVRVQPYEGIAVWARPTVADDRRSMELLVNPLWTELEHEGSCMWEHSAQALAELSTSDSVPMLIVLDERVRQLKRARRAEGRDGYVIDRDAPRDEAPDAYIAVLVTPTVVTVELDEQAAQATDGVS